MTTFDPQHNMAALAERLRGHDGMIVACLCAAWCDTCTQYRPSFQELAERWPQHLFVWIDIEENPEFLGDEDVENFPTLLIQSSESTLFFGPMLPYISHLEKLLDHVQGLTPLAAGEGPPLLRQVAQV